MRESFDSFDSLAPMKAINGTPYCKNDGAARKFFELKVTIIPDLEISRFNLQLPEKSVFDRERNGIAWTGADASFDELKIKL
jgi:hypothetical protein